MSMLYKLALMGALVSFVLWAVCITVRPLREKYLYLIGNVMLFGCAILCQILRR